MHDLDEIAALRAENARLIALLEAHGIEWRQPPELQRTELAQEASPLSIAEKLALFRRLFRGCDDVYPVRWESRKGHSGYTPACANEWREGLCDKRAVKCSECSHRQLLPLTDPVIYDHLAGQHTIGVYPLLRDDHCHFLAVDFDEAEWRQDALAFAQSCDALDVPVALEISRSGEGAHAWVFFAERVLASDARRLGAALISHTCARTRQLRLSSYDRLFPNQDRMPKGGFGNLIALPLQKTPRAHGRSLFVDRDWHAYPDQWTFLASVRHMDPRDIEPTILKAVGGAQSLDVSFIDEEDLAQPWKPPTPPSTRLSGPLPKQIRITLANGLYLEKAPLPQPLTNRLIRLAAFQNPDFYRLQAMRLSVWGKPRVIGRAEGYPQHLALPRGCLDAALVLLSDNGIEIDLQDERLAGQSIAVDFLGALRAMLDHDMGVLCAPTAFGKTVVAAAMIARRRVNTLILVQRTDLLKQWQERLQAFLELGPDRVGTIGGGKSKPSGRIDIAVMQSLSHKGEVKALVEDYRQVIIDECHHISAPSLEAILKRVRARYVLGLTATPMRRDGQDPIIFMQAGSLRYSAAKPPTAPCDLAVIPHELHVPIDLPAGAGIHTIFQHLAMDQARTETIAAAVRALIERGRKILVLTERADHLAAISADLEGMAPVPFILHGRMSRRERSETIALLDALPPDAPRAVLATGRLVGEGSDHPPLDTLVLAMPISWTGTLQQYAGRLHREHASKTDVRIIDCVDMGHPALQRMWERRQKGYRAMGYRIALQPELEGW
jgi:superfamily II DNA or RNA helicase